MMRKKQQPYDVVIIGSGPAGLAALSCLQEEYSLDILDETQLQRASSWIRKGNRKKKRVLVVDPNETWLDDWERNFGTLDINFLRSPAVAHCSYFDRNALLAYAVSQGREDELLESGCSDIKSLKGTILPSVGLWKLPSTQLFLDFSRDLASTLAHEYHRGKVVDIQKGEQDESKFDLWISHETAANDNNNNPAAVNEETESETESEADEAERDVGSECNGSCCQPKPPCPQEQPNLLKISSNSVIIATGTVGHPIVPRPLQPIVNSRNKDNNNHKCNIFQWKNLHQAINLTQSLSKSKPQTRILVIGGGLTAVQAAQKLVKSTDSSSSITLLSRKPFVERHFDIPVKWFDWREAQLHQSQFYHEPQEERVKALKVTRGGGTVPPLYMDGVRRMMKKGSLDVRVGDILSIEESENISCDEHESNNHKTIKVRIGKRVAGDQSMSGTPQGQEMEYDVVVLACGIQPDILAHPLLRRVCDQWPVEIQGGFPVISEDLKLAENLHVVGGLASLAVGPDAANLMGISRGAELVANALNSKVWLRDQKSNVLRNPYDFFLDTDVSSDEESDED